MEKITLYVSPHDFAQSQRFRLRSPLLFALQRSTGTLWRYNDDGSLREAMQPFRICWLSPTLLETMEEYGQNASFYPIIVELELQPSPTDNDYQTAGEYSLAPQNVIQDHNIPRDAVV